MYLVWALIISLQSFAFADDFCSTYLHDQTIVSVATDLDILTIIDKEIPFPRKKMAELGIDYKTENCRRTRLNVMEIITTTNKFKLIYTTDSMCDDGEPFGYVTDMKDQIIAKITNSVINCL